MAWRTSTLLPASPSQPRSSLACLLVHMASGEPSGVQMLAYLAADLAGRVRKMMPCRISHQIGLGISTTR